MMRFIVPSDEAKMQTWLAANPVPSSVSGILPADRNVKTISVQKDDMDGRNGKSCWFLGVEVRRTSSRKQAARIHRSRHGLTPAAIGISPQTRRRPLPPRNKRSHPMGQIHHPTWRQTRATNAGAFLFVAARR